MKLVKKVFLFGVFGLIVSCTSNETKEIKEIPNHKIDYSILNSKVYTTAQNTDLKLAFTDSVKFNDFQQPLETQASILINPTKKYQTLVGIGAALTDASAETFYKLSEKNQELFLQSYFTIDNGIGYSLARTIIHSCDFSTKSYTYIDEGDTELKTFSIDHDREFRLPFTKKAIEAAGGKLTMYASPWSPPAFMKTNNNMLKGGKLKPEFYQPWANYYAKFIKAYEKEGIPIWGLTIQNEPMAVQIWESCIYTAEEERDFLKNYLGPTLEKEGLGDKNIIIWDHNRDLLFERSTIILNDPDANKYVWGSGFHWYEDWKDGTPIYTNVAKVNEAFPDKKLIFTEGCNEGYDINRINDPKLAERYGKSMINDFNNGTVAWTDWNILLDETGGPNHVGNLCFAPVHGDTQTDALTFTNSYYYIGHFSKFIRPGAKRLSTGTTANHLSATSFMNTDGSIVVVALNDSDEELNYLLSIDVKTANLKMPAHSIQTIILN
ncbi:MAG: glycosyl hydrolase [Lutibacter sp.]|uniref:glycoside hydrolase family 30 protein n=1 Tax=Lutibacter sp. TaxID=1925666 RepID=UPI0017F2A6AD|nr:glycoside hydrolase family 30 beta sandwich domain-containing protein [Lutibacter sp.]MBT8316001.1 glycosyl hydrolase [Lutibacter sp.]NNJ56861.1 glycosyl hydrolase [Lutibacter sp.]